jgi:hypothetical protein
MQARRERRLTLPDAPPGPPMEALGAWFEQLERLDLSGAAVGRILLCIDEFERWEGFFPDDRRALLQLLGLLRATIQHRRRLRVLIAGAVTHRQRPGTARGVTFLNIEDETGMVNVLCTSGLWTRYRRVAQSASALLIRGRVQNASGAVTVLAERMRPIALAVGSRSRDFR